MRILNNPESPISGAADPAPVVPMPDLGRVEALEKIATSILQKIQNIEERIKILESSSPPSVSVGGDDSAILPSPITMDTTALKKDLFTKMWKYLNDKAAA